MVTKGKSIENWLEDLSNSLIEQDVMQLRDKLNDTRILTENMLQSYNMNSDQNVGQMD